ncbi:L,D-transpeptidase family protein [Pelagibius sp. Alg239-R121]|uniref:L,D-transpeptidase family protein n=1 Tax=Pelagibius sp. Alg239-R121 TaxID=2993448 RepID=UPI0024A6D23E|nr:L,D-transpeptidase family protein [Pelagibius sp. Alg239-R121]
MALAVFAGTILTQPILKAADVPALIGKQSNYVIADGETLLDVAVANDLGYVELLLANPGVDPWLPPPGISIVLPHSHLLPETKHQGIVVNLPELRLYYFPDSGGQLRTYPIGIGSMHNETPTGQTTVIKKRTNPSWIPPESIRQENPDLPEIVPPGPQNPLGNHALNLAWTGYIIHGTNRPYGIGRRVSHGCIRMYPADISELFELVEVGIPVRIIDQPVKVGWVNGELYLEVHPTAIQIDALAATGRLTPYAIPKTAETVLAAAKAQSDRLNWSVIRRVSMERRGIPIRITEPNDS